VVREVVDGVERSEVGESARDWLRELHAGTRCEVFLQCKGWISQHRTLAIESLIEKERS